ncbi:MAG: alpha/beta fold hydrolase [Thermoleophilaceae bacterium]
MDHASRGSLEERRIEVDGVPVFWREAPTPAGRAPALYLHGVPTNSDDWVPFLERTGGVALDLPGFGRSGKPTEFDYSIPGYRRFLHAFLDKLGLERISMVVHDWGGVGLALAQEAPERIQRLVVANCVPLLPGYRWHRIARVWRTPVLGELFMGFTNRMSFRVISRESNATPGPDARGVHRLGDRPLRPWHAAGDPAPLPLGSAGCAGRRRRAPRRGQVPGAGALGRGGPVHPHVVRAGLRRRARRPHSRRGRPRRRPLAVARPPGAHRHRGRLPARRRGVAFFSVGPTRPGGRAAGARAPGLALVLDRAVPTLLAVALGVTYAVLAPRTGDLPAHVFRAELFGREGITVWNGQWYSGHHTPAYSLLFPPLAWLLGPWVAGAVSAVAATALFEPLARRRFGASGARVAAPLFALGMGATIFAGRLTFALGVAIGVGALLALEQRRGIAGCRASRAVRARQPRGRAVRSAGGSDRHGQRCAAHRSRIGAAVTGRPARRGRPRRGRGARAARAPRRRLPRGRQPAVRRLLLPARSRACPRRSPSSRPARSAASAWARCSTRLAMTASFLIATPMGGNAVRLGQVAGAAVAAGALLARPLPGARRAAGAVLVGALLVWQITPAVRDLRNADGRAIDARPPTSRRSLEFLERRGRTTPTASRSRSRASTGRPPRSRAGFPIARGWLRSTDIAANPIFYERAPGHREYERWLRDHAVRLRRPRRRAARLLGRARRPRSSPRRRRYLRMRWRSEHWRVFEVVPRPAVASTRSLAPAPGRVGRLLVPDGAVLDASRATADAALVRVRYTPYWIVQRRMRRSRRRVDSPSRSPRGRSLHPRDLVLAGPRRPPRRPLLRTRPSLESARCPGPGTGSGAGSRKAGATRSASSGSSPSPTTCTAWSGG